jgi:hypothetical protein
MPIYERFDDSNHAPRRSAKLIDQQSQELDPSCIRLPTGYPLKLTFLWALSHRDLLVDTPQRQR